VPEPPLEPFRALGLVRLADEDGLALHGEGLPGRHVLDALDGDDGEPRLVLALKEGLDDLRLLRAVLQREVLGHERVLDLLPGRGRLEGAAGAAEEVAQPLELVGRRRVRVVEGEPGTREGEIFPATARGAIG
jgi:hypothetical protein